MIVMFVGYEFPKRGPHRVGQIRVQLVSEVFVCEKATLIKGEKKLLEEEATLLRFDSRLIAVYHAHQRGVSF